MTRRDRRRDQALAREGVSYARPPQTLKQYTSLPRLCGPADRKALLLGTALASTLLLATVVAPAPAHAVRACNQPASPTPIVDNVNDDALICVNTEPRIANAGDAIQLTTNGANRYIDLTTSGPLSAYNNAGNARGIYTTTGIADNSAISITSCGSIVATSITVDGEGIRALTSGSNSDIAIVSTGSIVSTGYVDANGINAGTNGPDSDVTIVSQGSIETTNTNTTDPFGNYRAYGIRSFTVDVDSDISITSSSSIKSRAHSAAFGISARVTNGEFNDISIVNSGDMVVRSTAAFAYGISSYIGENDSRIRIHNSGDFQVTGFLRAIGIYARAGDPDSPIEIYNSGEIRTETTGNDARAVAINARSIDVDNRISIMNKGDLWLKTIGEASLAYGILASSTSDSNPVNVANSGDIHVTTSGIEANAAGIRVVVRSNSPVEIINSGDIRVTTSGRNASARGIDGASASGNSPVVIVNRGDVHATATNPDAVAFGIRAQTEEAGSPITIHNSGSLFAEGGAFNAGILAFSEVANPTRIFNTGEISAASYQAIDVYAAGDSAGTAQIYNAGLITGFVNLTNQNDRFFNQAGGVFKTKLTSNFRGGNDLFVNEAGGTLQAATDPLKVEESRLVGLETFRNRGLISMVDGAAGDRFTISNTPMGTDLDFEGGGTLGVDAFLDGPANGHSDVFRIEGNVSGVTTVVVNNTNVGPGTFNPVGFTVVDVTGATPDPSAFQLAQPVDTGFFDYDLYFVPTGSGIWEFRSFTGAGAFLLPQLVTAAQDIWHQGSSTWFDRTADLRVLLAGGMAPTAYDPSGSKSLEAAGPYPLTPAVWARGSGSWLDRDASASTSAYGRNYSFNLDRELTTLDFQVGVDLGQRDMWSDGDALVFGMLGGFVYGGLDYDAIPRSFDFSGGQVGAYATYMNGGLFVDTLLNVHLYELSTATLGFPSSLDANTVGLRTDAGYRFGSFTGGAFLEPLATIEVTWADIDGFSLGGNRVSFDDDANVRGRLGLRAGTTMEAWEGTLMEPFVIGSVWGNLSGDNSATLVSTGRTFRFQDDLEDVWGEISGGLNFFNFSQTTAVFAKVDVTVGDDISGVGGKAGMRVNW